MSQVLTAILMDHSWSATCCWFLELPYHWNPQYRKPTNNKAIPWDQPHARTGQPVNAHTSFCLSEWFVSLGLTWTAMLRGQPAVHISACPPPPAVMLIPSKLLLMLLTTVTVHVHWPLFICVKIVSSSELWCCQWCWLVILVLGRAICCHDSPEMSSIWKARVQLVLNLLQGQCCCVTENFKKRSYH